jgi:DNA-binding MarR family transcriptional regulator
LEVFNEAFTACSPFSAGNGRVVAPWRRGTGRLIVTRQVPTAILIKWADMAARSRLEAALRPWRLSLGQMLLLGMIDRLGEATAAQLARALHLTPQAMTTLLRPLVERGVIIRDVDSKNRRRLSITLTGAGESLLSDIRASTERVDVELTSSMSEEELVQFRSLLSKIAQPPAEGTEPVRKERDVGGIG